MPAARRLRRIRMRRTFLAALALTAAVAFIGVTMMGGFGAG